ncbi:MAG TPA: hypothetical protein VGQ83_42130 [Polyangia bacterium]|jgi:hypothetical protein
MSPFWGGARGAATLGSGTAGVSGAVGPANSVIGPVARGHLGATVQEDPVHKVFIAGGLVEMALQSLAVRSYPGEL